jgi:hypothetical protein
MNRYKSTKIEKQPDTGIRYYRNTIYPIIPFSSDDIYVVTTDGDRLDLLAQTYYNDITLWWVISAANSDLPQNSLFIPVGSQIRIPANVNNIINEYNTLNN